MRAAGDVAIGRGCGYAWRPAPAVRASAWLHAAGATLCAVEPPLWPWVLGTLAGNHLLLGTAVLWPRGTLLGANIARLPAAAAGRGEVCMTFDDGPDPEVTPRVLDLLDRHGAKASFFCVGTRAAAHPDLVREIARRGHSVENHSYRHAHAFAFYGLGRLRDEVGRAQDLIAGITGRTPAFFRAPAGFRSPLLDPVLALHGLRYVSWTRRGFDAVHGDSGAVLRRLTRRLAAGDLLLLHDGDGARTPAGAAVTLEVLPRLLERFAAAGLKSVTLSAACGEDPA